MFFFVRNELPSLKQEENLLQLGMIGKSSCMFEKKREKIACAMITLNNIMFDIKVT